MTTPNTMLDSGSQVNLVDAIVFDKGTGTEASNAVTINHQCGVITTSSLSLASGATYSITLTNSYVTSSSAFLTGWMGGTTNRNQFLLYTTPGNGTATITIFNKSASSMSGTVIIGFAVF
jgi:hypothetical protein